MFIVYLDNNLQWRWRLRAMNHRIVADSGEGYLSKGDCLHAVALVKQLAPIAPVQ